MIMGGDEIQPISSLYHHPESKSSV